MHLSKKTLKDIFQAKTSWLQGYSSHSNNVLKRPPSLWKKVNKIIDGTLLQVKNLNQMYKPLYSAILKKKVIGCKANKSCLCIKR